MQVSSPGWALSRPEPPPCTEVSLKMASSRRAMVVEAAEAEASSEVSRKTASSRRAAVAEASEAEASLRCAAVAVAVRVAVAFPQAG